MIDGILLLVVEPRSVEFAFESRNRLASSAAISGEGDHFTFRLQHLAGGDELTLGALRIERFLKHPRPIDGCFDLLRRECKAMLKCSSRHLMPLNG